MKQCSYAAIVLAAGKGKRMNTKTPKQYLEVDGKPILYYALKTFEESPVDEIILVTGADETEYCRTQIIEKYGFKKVTAVIPGGKERYHSVYLGLKQIKNADYVLIHDGARPFVTAKMIADSMQAVTECEACVCAVPSKDTVKIADDDGFAKETPDRSKVYLVQTPQTFSLPLIKKAYESLMEQESILVTDDAMVVEQMTRKKVRLIDGDYHNIKITTPEDLAFAKTMINF